MPGPHLFLKKITLEDVLVLSGSIDPNGNVVAPAGSLFLRDGLGELYRNEDGATKWVRFNILIGSITAYDSTGGQTFTTTATTINLDATHRSDPSFSLASDEITVSENGDYEIDWSVSLESSGGGRTQASSWVEQNSVEISGTRGEHYLRQNNFGATSSGTINLTLAAGDAIRLRAQRSTGGGTCETQINGSRLTIKRLS